MCGRIRHLFSQAMMCSAYQAHVQNKRGCAIRIRHIIRTSEDVQYKEGRLSSLDPMNELSVLLLYQVKAVSSLWQASKIN